jgi:hypothetical protein
MAMTKKQQDAYFAEARKRGNVKTGEIITPGSIVRGVAKVAAKVAGKQAIKAGAKANARGLKAAQKPTNRTGTKADRAQRAELQGNSNRIKNADPARANRTRGGSLAAMKTYGGQGLATAKLTPRQAANRAEINKELNPARKAKELTSKKNLKNTKPMQNVPKDVSDRFNATVKRLAAEEAKKKKK